jgi:hypothetical protein
MLRAFFLLDDVRQERHKPRTLDRVCEFALVPGAHAGALAWHDLSEGRQESLERPRIFIINGFDIRPAKRALSFSCF